MHAPQKEDAVVFRLRAANFADLLQIASLIVQLYDIEIPGALSGAPEKKRDLLQYTLEANGEKALLQRYVICDREGRVAATGMLQFPSDPAFERAPAGTVQQALSLLGARHAARLLFTVAKSLLAVYDQRHPEAALIHSVVVDEPYRGRGLGRMLMDELERTAAGHGYRFARLQVLADNEAARRLYLQRGYQDIWHSPAWVSAFTWATYVMQKPLIREENTP